MFATSTFRSVVVAESVMSGKASKNRVKGARRSHPFKLSSAYHKVLPLLHKPSRPPHTSSTFDEYNHDQKLHKTELHGAHIREPFRKKGKGSHAKRYMLPKKREQSYELRP